MICSVRISGLLWGAVVVVNVVVASFVKADFVVMATESGRWDCEASLARVWMVSVRV